MRRRRASQAEQTSLDLPKGVLLGRRLAGEQVLPQHGTDLVLLFEALRRHVLLMGRSGSGKTETAMRLVYEIARLTDFAIFYLDAKGSRANAERFAALMEAAGRRARVFPNEPLDAFRGDANAIVNRFLSVVRFATEGPAAYYRDIARRVLQLVCSPPYDPPRTSTELRWRMDIGRLREAHGADLGGINGNADLVAETLMRYESFFGQVGGLLDGEWSWDDTDAAYVLLDAMALRDTAAGSGAVIFDDFAHYFALRKPLDRPCVMFVDEFSSLAGHIDVATKVEQAREFNAGLVLIPQVASGMGDRTQHDRILGSVETMLLHALNDPIEMIQYAGTRRVPDLTFRVGGSVEDRSRQGYMRFMETPKIDPNEIRILSPGQAWVVRAGLAGKVAIYRAPEIRAPLPPAHSPAPPPKPRPTASKHLGKYDSIFGDM